jgi:hypothetical protein
MAFWTDGGIAKDPKRNFRFKVEIGGFSESASDANGGGDTTVWWAKKIQKPNFTTAESKHVFMGHTFYWPGKTEWQEISMTLVDPVSPDAMAILSNIVEKSGYDLPKLNEPLLTQSKSKSVSSLGPVRIIQIDSDDNEIESWTLHHPFIKKISFSDLDYENDELTTIDISLRYDWAECKTANVNDAFFSKNGPALP